MTKNMVGQQLRSVVNGTQELYGKVKMRFHATGQSA